jgi:hypothetical protein
MMITETDCLTSCREEWGDKLHRIKQILESAEARVQAKTDPEKDSVYFSPNRSIMVGQVRWWEVNDQFFQACKVGLLGPISARWERLCDVPGGIHELVMYGAHSTMSVVHLSHPNEVPRPSTRRKNLRTLNGQLPLFFEFPEADEALELAHVTLVHGGKEEKFAYLRVYFDSEYPERYIQLTDNIMTLPIVLEAAEVEQVQEAEVGIKPHLVKKKEDSEQ